MFRLRVRSLREAHSLLNMTNKRSSLLARHDRYYAHNIRMPVAMRTAQRMRRSHGVGTRVLK